MNVNLYEDRLDFVLMNLPNQELAAGDKFPVKIDQSELTAEVIYAVDDMLSFKLISTRPDEVVKLLSAGQSLTLGTRTPITLPISGASSDIKNVFLEAAAEHMNMSIYGVAADDAPIALKIGRAFCSGELDPFGDDKGYCIVRTESGGASGYGLYADGAGRFGFALPVEGDVREVLKFKNMDVSVDKKLAVRANVNFARIDGEDVALLTKSGREAHELAAQMANGNVLSVAYSDDLTLSLKGVTKAERALRDEADADHIDLSAFGYDPGDQISASESKAPANKPTTPPAPLPKPSKPYSDCAEADAFQQCTEDVVEQNGYHHIVNTKCSGEAVVRLLCWTGEAEHCDYSKLRYNPDDSSTASSGDYIEYYANSSANNLVVILFNRESAQKCVRRIAGDYDSLLDGSGELGHNYRANLERDGLPYHEP